MRPAASRPNHHGDGMHRIASRVRLHAVLAVGSASAELVRSRCRGLPLESEALPCRPRSSRDHMTLVPRRATVCADLDACDLRGAPRPAGDEMPTRRQPVLVSGPYDHRVHVNLLSRLEVLATSEFA